MFDYNPFVHMVRFVLWLDRDRDEDPRFHLISLGCMDLFSSHDCKDDHFYTDGYVHALDPCIMCDLQVS